MVAEFTKSSETPYAEATTLLTEAIETMIPAEATRAKNRLARLTQRQRDCTHSWLDALLYYDLVNDLFLIIST